MSERGLITSLVGNEDLGSYLPLIQRKWFQEPLCIRAFDIIERHWSKHREPISPKLFKKLLRSFEMEHWTTRPEVAIDTVRSDYLRSRVLAAMEDFSADDEDPDAALAQIVGALSAVQAECVKGTGLDISSTVSASVDRYEYRRDHRGELGLPFPWLPLQRVTQGAADGSYTLLYGRGKSMKTFISLVILKHWVMETGRKVLGISKEMTPEQLQDRWLCLWAEVPYNDFRAGTLSEDHEAKVREAASEVAQIGSFFTDSITESGANAVAVLDAMCDQYGIVSGDVVFIDGLYFFADQSQWASFRAVSQGLKSLALRRKIVLLVTTQGNRNTGAKLSDDAGAEIGLGDGPVQDCDLALRLRRSAEEEHVIIQVAAIREGEQAEFVVHAMPCTNFTLKYSDSPDPGGIGHLPAPSAKAIKVKVKTGKSAKIKK